MIIVWVHVPCVLLLHLQHQSLQGVSLEVSIKRQEVKFKVKAKRQRLKRKWKLLELAQVVKADEWSEHGVTLDLESSGSEYQEY